MEAWHFLSDDRKLQYGDGREAVVGETLTVDASMLRICSYGLHACERAIDALARAKGSIICRVMLGGTILRDEDELCASERTVLWMADANSVLREFARWCALQVIHLWDAPDVVRRYLETGDESLMKATYYAARRIASNPEFKNNSSITYSDIYDYVWNVKHNAACSAADSADSGFAYKIASSAADNAAWSAAYDPCLGNEWKIANHDNRIAAKKAVEDTQNTKLEEMLWGLKT